MTQGFYEILSNVTIAKDIYEMVLGGDTSAITAPGQFINIKVEGFYLRRPISICDWNENTITILFKTVGEGTQRLSEMKVGEKLDILVGLGNGFDVNACGENPLLVGGGIGTPPMYGLCKRLLAMGKKPAVILGFASECDVVYEEKFNELGVETRIATVDGSRKAVYGYDQRGEVFGSKGCATTQNDTASNVILSNVDGVTGEKPLWFFLERYMGSYQAEVREFIECILKGEQPKTGIEDGLVSIKLALACNKSLKENRPVRVDEI